VAKCAPFIPTLNWFELLLSSRIKSQSSDRLALQKIAPLIHEIRAERVILDVDLAAIYGVTVKALNQAVKRNIDRFPEDFAFRLTQDEFNSVRSQTVTLKRGQHRKYLPHVFTEHEAIMAANVLNSKEAVQMSVFVVRAFIKLRETLSTNRELAAKIDELDRKVGTHDKAISSIIAAIRQLTAPAARKPRAIGFRPKRNGERILA
jgi:hypothetical protein